MRHATMILCLAVSVGLVAFATASAEGQSVFTATGGSGAQGAVVDSFVLFDTTVNTQGWSFGVCHDGADLMLIDSVEGSTTLTVNNGGAPDFVAINTDPMPGPGVTMGVVINFLGMAVLPPSMGAEILVTSYELTGMPGEDSILTDVCFCDTLGTPPVQTTIVLEGGAAEIPVQNCGTITITPPPSLELFCTDGLNQVQLDWVAGPPGFDQFLLYRDGDLIDLFDGMTTSYLDPVAPGTYVYTVVGIDFPEPQGEPFIDFSQCVGTSFTVTIDDGGINPNVGYYLGGETITITGTGFMAAPDTSVDIGGMPCSNVMVMDDNTLTCDTPPSASLGFFDVTVMNSVGSDTVIDGFEYGFIRGEINEDAEVNLADPIFALEYLFIGGTAPSCFDALDVDDNGSHDLADPVYLLVYLFAMMPAPPSPFPGPGPDPTGGDPLGCL